MKMIRDESYSVLATKLITVAEKCFSENEVVTFSVFGGFDPDEMAFFIAVELGEEDTFAFTLEQAKKLVPNMAFSLQFNENPDYLAFARMIMRNFSAAIKEIEATSESEIAAFIIRRDKK